MRVAIAHTSRLNYSADVVEGVMDVRLGPFSDDHQRWDRYDLRVAPAASRRRYTDGFGNAGHLITLAQPHRYVEVVSGGEVETLLADPFADPVDPPRPLGPAERSDYLRPSALIEPHPELDRLAAPFRPPYPKDTFRAVQDLMKLIYDSFDYKPNVTSVSTTVPEVLTDRAGVCQDFAHVLIGLCRSIDIPARYVSGYIVVSTQAQSQTLGTMSQSQSQNQGPGRGGGASHAWIEAYTPTHGWRGFDPTNNLVASLNHVKMAIGRDYNDVPPTRGSFRGAAQETLDVRVTAEKIR